MKPAAYNVHVEDVNQIIFYRLVQGFYKDLIADWILGLMKAAKSYIQCVTKRTKRLNYKQLKATYSCRVLILSVYERLFLITGSRFIPW